MNGVAWIFLWLAYLAVGIGGAALWSRVRVQWVRPWLSIALGIGAFILLIMTGSLLTHQTSRLVLPHPWPALVASPLPMAPLWAVMGGLLFFSATLLTVNRPDSHRVHYALLPLLAIVGIYLWSGDGLLLLVSWELISGVSYLGLVTTRRARPVWNAGWVLLALSELGGMLLLVALVWLTPGHGPLMNDALPQLARIAAHQSPALINILMMLTIVAFGVKAGLFPVMIWMPMAEPEAPGVVAGLFSGLITALAIAGILAMVPLAGHSLTWAVAIIILGVLGSFSGALYSAVSRHVKRVLAYSTLEVLGMVFVGLGIWRLLSIEAPNNAASTLALDAAIVLLIIHAGAKFILFAGTDFTGRWGHTLDALGGLHRASRTVTVLTLIAVLGLGAVPPLGGFVGEWLLLESLLKPLAPSGQAVLHVALIAAGIMLAITAALAVTAYLRWYGFIFLGQYRGLKAIDHRPSTTWLSGLALPLALVVVTGPGVPWLLPWINARLGSFLTARSAVIAPSFHHPGSAAPLVPIGVNLVPAPGAPGTAFFPQAFNVGDPYVLFWMGLVLGATVAAIRWILRRRRGVRLVRPWNGGTAVISRNASWSAEGFVHPLRLAFARFYGLERTRKQSAGAHFYRHTIIYRVEEQLYRPLVSAAVWVGRMGRRIQSGRVTQYVAYVWIFALVGIMVGIMR